MQSQGLKCDWLLFSHFPASAIVSAVASVSLILLSSLSASVSLCLCLSLSLPCLSASLILAVSASAPRSGPLWCLLLPVQNRLSPSLSPSFSLS